MTSDARGVDALERSFHRSAIDTEQVRIDFYSCPSQHPLPTTNELLRQRDVAPRWARGPVAHIGEMR